MTRLEYLKQVKNMVHAVIVEARYLLREIEPTVSPATRIAALTESADALRKLNDEVRRLTWREAQLLESLSDCTRRIHQLETDWNVALREAHEARQERDRLKLELDSKRGS